MEKCSDWSRILNKICSSVLVPLLIGLATVVISIVQLQIAAEQRQQDLFLSDNLQKDRILGDYIEQISRLILLPNFNLSDAKIGNICRAKTLTAIRQLDPRRKSYLIKFLYAAELIRNSQSKINLFEADLDFLDFSTRPFRLNNSKLKFNVSDSDFLYPLVDLAFKRVSLNNASFAFQSLKGANFDEASMIGVNFTACRFWSVSFVRTDLRFADFRQSSHRESLDFTSANLFGAEIADEILNEAISIEDAILPNGTIGVERNLLVEEKNCQNFTSWKIRPVRGNVEIKILESNCFFGAQGDQGEVTMFQKVRLQPFFSIDDETNLLKLRLTCAPVDPMERKEISIAFQLEQFDENEKSLANFSRTVDFGGQFTRLITPHKFLRQLKFSINFIRNENSSKNFLFAFCGEIHLNLIRDRRNKIEDAR